MLDDLLDLIEDMLYCGWDLWEILDEIEDEFAGNKLTYPLPD